MRTEFFENDRSPLSSPSFWKKIKLIDETETIIVNINYKLYIVISDFPVDPQPGCEKSLAEN